MEPAAPLQALAPGVNAGCKWAGHSCGSAPPGLWLLHGRRRKTTVTPRGFRPGHRSSSPPFHFIIRIPTSRAPLGSCTWTQCQHPLFGNSTVRYQARPRAIWRLMWSIRATFPPKAPCPGRGSRLGERSLLHPGEYLHSSSSRRAGGALNFDGFYASAAGSSPAKAGPTTGLMAPSRG